MKIYILHLQYIQFQLQSLVRAEKINTSRAIPDLYNRPYTVGYVTGLSHYSDVLFICN